MSSAEGGIRFGQYVLLRRIARGGMAEVFLAQQRGLEGFDRRVAVKRILPHLADAPDFVKMFLGEARLAAQLTHPNVVHIYDFGKHDGDYFIAMEYVEGVHTGQLFKYGETERMPPTMVARIGADAATALHYAHELRGSNGKPLGLVHRDVSPANIMVSFDGVVKLCDFGIAKAVAAGDQLTNPGQVKGKYAYMSPEQTIAAPLDGRSDVFSLAIVLWELLAGKTIVPRGDAVDAMRAIRDGKLMPIDKVAPRTPPALAKAITWALQTRREHRATAMDFAQALETFIKSSPELATPMQLGSWIRQRFARDHTGPQQAIPGVSVGTRVAPGTIAAPGTAASPGTLAAPGTMAAPGTVAGGDTPMPSAITPKPSLVTPPGEISVITPSSLIAASDLHSSDDLLDSAETILITDEHDHGRANDATLIDPQSRAANETTQRDGAIVTGGDDTVAETRMRSGAYRPPVPAGPSVVPTIVSERPVRRRSPSPVATEMMTAGVARRGPRAAIAIAGLVGLAVISFLIALAARAGRSGSTAHDAGAAVPADAAPAAADAAPHPIDPAIIMEDPPADAREPTIRPDEDLTYLEVRTKPSGGDVKIGGEVRHDPARFALVAGRYTVVASLDGYVDEKRTVELERGIDLVQEIAFTRRKPTGRATPQPGRLTVRTTPYSVVFLGGKRLGETPFADKELPAGTYSLTFRNPRRATVTKKVTITGGQTTKLNFALP